MFNGIIWMVTVIYPFLVWFSLDYLQPRYLALILAGLFLLRFLHRKREQANERDLALAFPACALFLLLIALINELAGYWLIQYLLVWCFSPFLPTASSIRRPLWNV